MPVQKQLTEVVSIQECRNSQLGRMFLPQQRMDVKRKNVEIFATPGKNATIYYENIATSAAL
jgi:hypothetical protein